MTLTTRAHAGTITDALRPFNRRPIDTHSAAPYARAMLSAALAALSALLCAALLVAERRESVGARLVTKSLASLAFVAAAVATLVAAGATDSTAGRATLVALVLSLIGDVLLVPSDPRAFLAGLGAFLLAHLAFAGAFLARGVTPTPTLVAALALLPVALFVGRWLLPHVEAAMRAPVVAYMTAISIMVALSVGAAAHTGRADLVIAAIVFFLSDLTVARDRFVAPGFPNRLVGLPLYYAAQIAFALGAA